MKACETPTSDLLAGTVMVESYRHLQAGVNLTKGVFRSLEPAKQVTA
jgi:hypothetical protein